MPICALCQEEGPLRRSHILADCCYRNAYTEQGRAAAVQFSDGAVRQRVVQTGEWQELLCDGCERFLGKNETYFALSWLEHPPLPATLTPGAVISIDVDYRRFKLFHLANLWRAGASSRPAFAHVQLGPHQERLRQMLLSEDPGDSLTYPLVGACLLDGQGVLHNQIVSPYLPLRDGGHTFQSVIHSGGEWVIRVSSHRCPPFDSDALQIDGHMSLPVVPWRDHPVLQSLASAYAKGRSCVRT